MVNNKDSTTWNSTQINDGYMKRDYLLRAMYWIRIITSEKSHLKEMDVCCIDHRLNLVKY